MRERETERGRQATKKEFGSTKTDSGNTRRKRELANQQIHQISFFSRKNLYHLPKNQEERGKGETVSLSVREPDFSPEEEAKDSQEEQVIRLACRLHKWVEVEVTEHALVAMET